MNGSPRMKYKKQLSPGANEDSCFLYKNFNKNLYKLGNSTQACVKQKRLFCFNLSLCT